MLYIINISIILRIFKSKRGRLILKKNEVCNKEKEKLKEESSCFQVKQK